MHNSERGKTRIYGAAAYGNVSGRFTAGLRAACITAYGNVSGQSNQQPYKVADFGGLIVGMGTQ